MKIIKQYETQKCMANVLFQQSQQTPSWLEPTQSAKVQSTNCETENKMKLHTYGKMQLTKYKSENEWSTFAAPLSRENTINYRQTKMVR